MLAPHSVIPTGTAQLHAMSVCIHQGSANDASQQYADIPTYIADILKAQQCSG